MTRLLNLFLFNPPILFAAAYVGYIGHDGGLGLSISLAFFVLICLSAIAGHCQNRSVFRHIPAFLSHKSMPQALVGLLAASAIPVALMAGRPIDNATLIFLCSAALYTVGNFCVAYQFARDFRPLMLTPVTLFFIPQIWSTAGHVAAMAYNGGLTMLALPLVLVMAWLAAVPRIGRVIVPRSVPNYLGAVYNIWYIACNIAGPAPNIYLILSCASCAVACCLLAQRAKAGELLAFSEQQTALQLAQSQESPIEPILVEVPNLVFSLPLNLPREPWFDGIYAPPPLYFTR